MKHRYHAFSSSLRAATALFAIIMCALISAGNVSHAATISAYVGASGPGLGIVTFGSVSTPNPFNDDVAGASPNTIIVTEKRFDSFDAIWMIFDVVDDGIGPTEYQLSETVTNNTGGVWIGYQVMLGTGTDAGWVHQPLGTGLDFDDPDDNSPRDFGVFGFSVYDQVTIDAGGGMIFPGESHVFTYAIDVPARYQPIHNPNIRSRSAHPRERTDMGKNQGVVQLIGKPG